LLLLFLSNFLDSVNFFSVRTKASILVKF
jgi:hypothetical protein